MVSISKASADNLNINLEIIYNVHNRFLSVEAIQKIAARKDNRPDYLLLNFYVSRTGDALDYLEDAQIPFITINTDLSPDEEQQLGQPQEKLHYWLASVMPDDMDYGYKSASYLLAQAARRKLTGDDGKIHLFGINGTRDTMAAHLRESALIKAVKEEDNIILEQMVYANWSASRAEFMTTALLIRHSQTHAIWAASDAMALAAADAAEKWGLTPGKDILITGTDWTPEAAEAIKNGRLLASSGGHFFDIPLALAIIYDNEHGLPIPAGQANIHREATLLNKNNINEFLPLLDENNWPGLNFRSLTRTHNPGLKNYRLETSELVRLLQRP